jgi:hypothetical protein
VILITDRRFEACKAVEQVDREQKAYCRVDSAFRFIVECGYRDARSGQRSSTYDEVVATEERRRGRALALVLP